MSDVSGRTQLAPSLWRTCRALANLCRLRMLQTLVEGPPRTVSEMAETLGIHEVIASRHLRLLNSRGLLRVRRVSRWVVYRVGHDPSIPETADILRGLRRQLAGSGYTIDDAFRDATAFTHPRRVSIVRVLSNAGALAFPALCARTAISAPALSRHIKKLEVRGIIRDSKGRYECARPPTPLSRVLLRLAVRGRGS